MVSLVFDLARITGSFVIRRLLPSRVAKIIEPESDTANVIGVVVIGVLVALILYLLVFLQRD